jgi:AcrR family transcriptional regulator
MKSGAHNETTERRPYRPLARAASSEATHRRIVKTFLGFARQRWLDEITLEEIAMASNVTVQTVIRHYSGKDGLIEAVAELFAEEIPARRAGDSRSLDRSITSLISDYEVTGDVVIRFLAQEDRYPVLGRILAKGRRHHRDWVEGLFARQLSSKTPARERQLSALIAATDVYTWKLLRRDLGHTPETAAAVIHDLVQCLIRETTESRRAHAI